MSARYYILLSDELADVTEWSAVPRFRLIEQHCTEPGAVGMHWWLCEDDDAAEALNGKRIEPWFTRHDDGTVTVTARRPA